MIPNRKCQQLKSTKIFNIYSTPSQASSNTQIQDKYQFQSNSSNSIEGNYKLQCKIKELKSHVLGDKVLQFGDKQTSNRLKLRHKKYATSTFLNRYNQPTSNPRTQKSKLNQQNLQKILYPQLNTNNKTPFAIKSHTKQPQKVFSMQWYSTVRKNQLSNTNSQQKISNFQNSITQSEQQQQNNKAQQQDSSQSNRRIEYFLQQQHLYKCNKNRKQQEQLIIYCNSQKFSNININKSYITLNQNKQKQNNTISQKYKNLQNNPNIHIPTTNIEKFKNNTNKYTHDEQNITTNTKDTISYFKLSLESIDNLDNIINIQDKQNISNTKISNNKLITQSNYKNYNINCSPALQQQLSTRIGLATIKYNLQSNSLPIKLQIINNKLDLGMKIIDDSFEISAIDEHAGSHHLWVNTSADYIKQHRYLGKSVSAGMLINNVQDIILDQSIVSPQCQHLKQKLNSILRQGQLTQTINNQIDDILLSLPMLQINSFIKSTSIYNYQQYHLSRYVSQSYQQQSIIKQTSKDKSFYVIQEIGLLVHQMQLGIDKTDGVDRKKVLSNIDNLLQLGYHNNIISLYSYNILQQDHQIIKIIMHKQPSLYPLYEKFTNSYLYNVYRVTDIQGKGISIEWANIRNIIKQLLPILTYCNKSFLSGNTNKNIIININNVYICQIPGNTKQYTIKVDIAHKQNIIRSNTNNTQIMIKNMQIILQIIKIFDKISNISKYKQYQYLINQFQLYTTILHKQKQFIQQLLDKTTLSVQQINRINNIQVIFWKNICMHTFFYGSIQNINNFGQISQIIL